MLSSVKTRVSFTGLLLMMFMTMVLRPPYLLVREPFTHQVRSSACEGGDTSRVCGVANAERHPFAQAPKGGVFLLLGDVSIITLGTDFLYRRTAANDVDDGWRWDNTSSQHSKSAADNETTRVALTVSSSSRCCIYETELLINQCIQDLYDSKRQQTICSNHRCNK